MIKNISQPEIITIDESLRLRRPSEKDWPLALKWYQDPEILYVAEGITDSVYDYRTVCRMYEYLGDLGELYFIEAFDHEWHPIGDVTLAESNLPITLGDKSKWGLGIGRKVLECLLKRGQEIGMTSITVPEIYHHNERSRRLFLSMGFEYTGQNEKASAYRLEFIPKR